MRWIVLSLPSISITLYIFLLLCLFSFIFSSVHVVALPVYSSPHLIILCLLPLHFSIVIYLPAYRLFNLCLVPLIDSQILFFVKIVLFSLFCFFQLLFTYITTSCVCSWTSSAPFQTFLLTCYWDYSWWQGLLAESLVEKYMNIYMNTKASSGLLVCSCLIEVSAESFFC